MLCYPCDKSKLAGLKKSNPQSPRKGRTAGTTRPGQEAQSIRLFCSLLRGLKDCKHSQNNKS
jgi:hypothetical protein